MFSLDSGIIFAVLPYCGMLQLINQFVRLTASVVSKSFVRLSILMCLSVKPSSPGALLRARWSRAWFSSKGVISFIVPSVGGMGIREYLGFRSRRTLVSSNYL